MSNDDLLILEKAANKLASVAAMYGDVRRQGFATGFADYEKEEREALESASAIRQLVGKYFLARYNAPKD